jgi:hypothetical protein
MVSDMYSLTQPMILQRQQKMLEIGMPSKDIMGTAHSGLSEVNAVHMNCGELYLILHQ